MRIFSNGFMNAILAFSLLGHFAWAGTPNVIEDARFKGDFGARFFAGVAPESVIDGLPDSETAYRARFYVSVNDLNLGNGNEVVIFAGRNPADVVQFELVLRGAGSRVNAFLRVRLDSGVLVDTPTGTLVRGWQALEVQWLAGDGSGAAMLLRDGESLGGLIDLDNDQSVIDDVVLGTVSETGAGNSGSFDVDDFSSRKLSNPGLACLTSEEFLGFIADWPARDILEEMDLLNKTCTP